MPYPNYKAIDKVLTMKTQPSRYIILPWCLLISLFFVMLLLLKLLSLKAMTSSFLITTSVCIGAPLGLYIAHWVSLTEQSRLYILGEIPYGDLLFAFV